MKVKFQTKIQSHSYFLPSNQSSMNFSLLILISLSWLDLHVKAQNAAANDAQTLHPFHPSLAAVIGVMGIMISIVILVLAYAKFCHRTPFNFLNRLHVEVQGDLTRSGSRLSGIDKTTIDKIPIFRFSSLRGSKRGLECAVCLSAFEDIEILRLLPKCKHAFHRNCIDEWLESHSSCPLCRQRFDAVDVTSFVFSSSLRLFHTPSNLTDDTGIELFIQREQDDPGPSRFNIGGSFRDKNKSRDMARDHKLHKLKHKIIVSDVVLKHRWSDVNSSDLMSLNSDMLNTSSSQRFWPFGSKSTRFSSKFPMSNDLLKIKDDMETKRRINESTFSMIQRSSSVSTSAEGNEARMINHNVKRSMSEITNVSRYKYLIGRSKAKESSPSNTKEERRRRLWLPIARRTLELFASFDKSHQQPDHHKMLPSNV